MLWPAPVGPGLFLSWPASPRPATKIQGGQLHGSVAFDMKKKRKIAACEEPKSVPIPKSKTVKASSGLLDCPSGAVRHACLEDVEDLHAFADREHEQTISFEDMQKRLFRIDS